MTTSGHRSYSYAESLKSDISDELINTYLVRPLGGLVVRVIYPTPITPNAVTIASTVAGLLAALLYALNVPMITIAAGVCLAVKDILDSADGQLARAKQKFSRAGRFLDSISDFVVNLCAMMAIFATLTVTFHNLWYVILGLLAFAGITFRVSYHVFYQTSFLHLREHYGTNRLTEEIRPEDLGADRWTLTLQRIFYGLYGWQDALMVRLDLWSRHGAALTPSQKELWYADRIALRISGFIGLGTELWLLILCSLANRLDVYVWINLGVMNGVLVAAVLYRRTRCAQRVRREERSVPA
jgi:phosphatidylglycerophosphate synthase